MSLEADLVRRYGPDVLKANRRSIPPRRARKGHHLAVIPKAARRAKLVKELKQEGYKAHVCRHRETKEVTVNMVFTNALPAFNKHAANVLAEIPTPDIRPLYGKRAPAPIKRRPFEVGDKVKTVVGWIGTVIEDRGRVFRVAEDETGRLLTVHEASMIRIDPG